MSLLAMAAAALYAAGGGGGYDSITADWADITCDDTTGAVTNTPVTITFSTGATRTLQVSGTLKGTLKYYIDSDPGIVITAGGTFDVVTGEDVSFSYESSRPASHELTVTVTDTTAGETVDSFELLYTYTGA